MDVDIKRIDVDTKRLKLDIKRLGIDIKTTELDIKRLDVEVKSIDVGGFTPYCKMLNINNTKTNEPCNQSITRLEFCD